MPKLAYTNFEPLAVPRPVARIPYVKQHCAGKRVLDLGCLDETALQKRNTPAWMHGQIAEVATSVLGVDASDKLPPEGLETSPRSRIVRGDVLDLERLVRGRDVDIVVAGELIEHLPNPLQLFQEIKRLFAGRELIATTPNATSISNVVLATAARESNHPDHTQVYSYKTLNTLCMRAGFDDWELRPYHLFSAEMQLRLGGWKATAVRALNGAVNAVEYAFPLLSFGMIVHVRRI